MSLSSSQPTWAVSLAAVVFTHHHRLVLLTTRLALIFIIPRRVEEGWINLGTAIMEHSPWLRLYITIIVITEFVLVFFWSDRGSRGWYDSPQPALMPVFIVTQCATPCLYVWVVCGYCHNDSACVCLWEPLCCIYLYCPAWLQVSVDARFYVWQEPSDPSPPTIPPKS